MKYTAKRFADDARVSTKLAKRIIDTLDKKELSAEDLNVVLWKLRDMVMKTQMPALLDKSKDEDIEAIIDQIIVERAMWRSRCDGPVCAAKNAEELSRAFNAGLVPEIAWFFEEIAEKAPSGGYKAGDLVTIQIFRVGKWEHPDYGTVEVTKKTIKDVVQNFEENRRGIDLCVDENHEPDHKALGWYKEVFADDGGRAAYAKIELTKKGADLLNEGAYKYFSPEICFHKTDEESGDLITNLLVGGAFTNRPFFKGMQPLMATEGAAANEKTGAHAALQRAYFFSPQATMHKFLMAMDALAEKETISASEKSKVEALYLELPEADRSADVQKAFAEIIAKYSEDGAAPAATPAPEATPEGEKPEEVAPAATPEEGAPEAEGVKPEGVEGTVEANEDGTYKVDALFMEGVKKAQATLSEMTRNATLSACESTTKSLLFSDKNPANVVLGKHVAKITKFAAGLSDANRKEFFEIVGSLKAVPAGSKGHGHNAQKPAGFSEAKDVPLDDERVKYFMETMKQTPEEAQASAFHFYQAAK